MKPKVINLHHGIVVPYGTNEKIVRVDRGSEWGNPFIMKEELDRDRVCDLFVEYASWRLSIEPKWLEPLRGKDLACHCAPKRCHAETLIYLSNR